MSGEKPNPAKIWPLGVFVEFSFIRFGWKKKSRSFSLYVPPVRRCSSCAAGTSAVRSIVLKTAGKLRKDALDKGATRATKAAKRVGWIIVTVRVPIVIAREYAVQA